MSSVQRAVDPKVVDRIKKLLALARDGGATEAEAALAMDRAQEIMRAHSLSVATVEAGGGVGESRQKEKSPGRADKPWMQEIMRALGESAFVHVDHAPGRYFHDEDGVKRRVFASFTLIGRESAVVQTRLMHEYLCKTIVRMARNRTDWPNERFMAGAGERVVERLRERHETMLRQQREDAERQRARQPAQGGGIALVVVLEDYAQKERDLNEDLRWGKPPGTTAAERKKREQNRLARERKFNDLLAQGVDQEAAWWVVHMNHTLEEAVARVQRDKTAVAAPPKEETEAQRERRTAREDRENQQAHERFRRRFYKEQARRSDPAYRAGQAAGDTVGLDAQVGRTERRKLT